MANYDEMVRLMRAERLERVSKRIVEACFEDEHGHCLGFPGHWKVTTCWRKPTERISGPSMPIGTPVVKSDTVHG